MTWILGLASALLGIALLSSVGFFRSFPRLLWAVLIWSAVWAGIAFIHNLFYPATRFSISNYCLEQELQLLFAFWEAVPILWTAPENLRLAELRLWLAASDFRLPFDAWDWFHLCASLVVALMLGSTQKNAAATQSGGNVQTQTNTTPSPPPDPPPERPLTYASEGPIDYRSIVDPVAVRSTAVGIVSAYPNHGLGPLLRAAALFEFVKNTVEYVPDPIRMERGQVVQGDMVAHPLETLKIRGGDCDDHAVLMASLLSAVGIPNRMRLVENVSGDWHLLTEFAIDSSLADEYSGALEEFYQNIDRPVRARTYWQFAEGDQIWLLADTTRDYVPDYEELISSGFLVKNAQGMVNWHNCPATF